MRSVALMAVLVSLGSSAAPGTAAAPSMDAGSGQGSPRAGDRARPDGRDRRRRRHRCDALRAQQHGVSPSGVGGEARGLVHRPPRSRPAVPVSNGAGRRRVANRARVAWKPRARRVRRSDAHARGSRSARAPVRRYRDQTRSGTRLRRRHVLRLAARRARLEAVVRRHRVEAALRALRGGRAVRGHATARPPQRPGRSPSRCELAASPSPDGPGEDELRPMRSRSRSTSPSGSRTSYRG